MPTTQPLRNALTFEKKNHDMLKLPKHAGIQKRPIPHAPIASPYAGSSVPKIVYISTNTPFMSAVKRVQKFLQQAEKRATASVNLSSSKKRDRERLAQIARGSEALKKEEVFVKATGRAIEKALRVGKWFEERESEYTVRVETGSVLVVDDVVEDEGRKRSLEEKVKGGGGGTSQGSESRAKKQRRAASALAAAEEELPETRTRWVNKVEVSIAFK
ncbi:Rpp20 subunit of nuclear RNase MRP and P-domain-containing protein [Aspergillus pseudonomiae]|uniref:Rpp20 subunit of nuclear RNase MRP and P-domain-containing protein n=1 Tax=Aspergillus pseudonomiae TaxID=1506151 RepID=A0A5N6I360_9EURO|nr:Rpp20 subunit of nuclear RNase MRP and P-domain-containing protein [Aspergillus pseudonomiae]KAB8261155.1 Rpp20 subunit of nuclear RNase MRP and P-domain-containing protein [Aspergillus pseudonomiae]KAE8403662.1 Rpp20 subunit of nuclear RNase MRP and P-domain-containing protein [Aspergillus pseudonomiae]